ncbi:MAG: hypothetical protein NTX28_12745 [Novosphingobium sp.]|nr:hypothetical protein [Novosphingobium sp.]
MACWVDRQDAGLHQAHRLAQPLHRLVEIVRHGLERGRNVGQADREIGIGNRVQVRADLGHRLFALLDRAVAFDGGIAKHHHGLRHGAQFVLAIGPRDGGIVLAPGQRNHGPRQVGDGCGDGLRQLARHHQRHADQQHRAHAKSDPRKQHGTFLSRGFSLDRLLLGIAHGAQRQHRIAHQHRFARLADGFLRRIALARLHDTDILVAPVLAPLQRFRA